MWFWESSIYHTRLQGTWEMSHCGEVTSPVKFRDVTKAGREIQFLPHSLTLYQLCKVPILGSLGQVHGNSSLPSKLMVCRTMKHSQEDKRGIAHQEHHRLALRSALHFWAGGKEWSFFFFNNMVYLKALSQERSNHATFKVELKALPVYVSFTPPWDGDGRQSGGRWHKWITFRNKCRIP